jgi:hypothetical protein
MTAPFEDSDFVKLETALENARIKLAARPDDADAKGWLEVLERIDEMKSILQPPK